MDRARTAVAASPEKIAINILGIGEITTTIEVKGPHWGKVHPTEKRWMRLAYKRMPAFESREVMERYLTAHNAYQDLLEAIGIAVPWHDNLHQQRPDGKWVVYNRQERFPASQVACLMIRQAPEALNRELFQLVLAKLALLFAHNRKHPEQLIGFDGQISNWILPDYHEGASDVSRDSSILYIDSSTPLLRYDGAEQLDTELFLKSVPAIFRPVIRAFMLQEILDRYYRPRDVVLDLVASYITHHRPDLVPALVEEANRFLAGAVPQAKPLTVKEITAYNRQDVMIWQFFRTLKRIDRYISERFLGKTYEQRLPSGSPKTWKNLVGAGGQGLSVEENEKS
jgi:hypothetical protein